MKILLVSPYDLAVSGGVNSHVFPLAEQIRRRGHDVVIAGPSSGPPLTGEDSRTVVVGRPVPIPTAGSVARVALSLRLSRRVKDLLARDDFDIVHVHEPLAGMLPITVLRHSQKVNVGTFHAAKEGGSRLYAYSRRLLKRWFRRLDGKIAVSRAAERLIGRYFPGYYNIIPNGITLEPYLNAEPLPEFMDGRPTVLFLGRMEKRKGLHYLLRAFILLKAEMPEARLVVVGDGRRRERYEKTVTKAGVTDVIFTGRVSEDDKPRYYASASVFCAPNTGNESQGYVLLEAMATGTPVVASNIEGFATVITDGVEGLLVEPKNPRALAAALHELLLDPKRGREMGQRGRDRAQFFGWDRVAQRVLSYYERLLYERRLAGESRARVSGGIGSREAAAGPSLD